MVTHVFNNLVTTYGWNTKELDAVLAIIPSELENFWLAGGALRRTITAEKIIGKSDFDFFFKSEEAYVAMVEAFSGIGFAIKRENDFNKTLEGEITIGEEKQKVIVQLIKVQYYGSVEALLDSFDFTLCQFALDTKTGTFYCGDTSMFDAARRRIVVHKVTYPVASLRRLIKYTSQGYYACHGCLTTFLEKVREIQPTSEAQIQYFD
jgi:hypothetical protein